MSKIRSLITFLCLLLIFVSCSENKAATAKVPVNAPYKNSNLTIEKRVSDLIGRMTLEEKVGQMTQIDRQYLKKEEDIAEYNLGSLLSGGGSTPQINSPVSWADMIDQYQRTAQTSRLGIPLLYGIDAVHGHNNVVGATIFPHNIGLGAANDADLTNRIARATAKETASTGIHWTFAPCVAVPRDERWGRTYEGFSEDSAIVSELGSAAIKGYQGSSLSDRETIAATAKHFLGDGGTEGGIDRGNTQVSERELREVHLPPYISAIDEGVATIMVSFSSWNGVKMHENPYLLNDVLRKELGFDGLILSDWAALKELPGSYRDQIKNGINAGIDMVMVPDDYTRFIQTTVSLVESGSIPQKRIDDALRKILTLKMELGLFENPYANRDLLKSVGSEEHRAIAREAVQKSQVLLKNNGVLPLSGENLSLVILGDLSDNLGAQCGGWTITWQGGNGDITGGTTIKEALDLALSTRKGQLYTSLDDEAIENADAVIVVVGEQPYAEFEGDDTKLEISKDQMEILRIAENTGLPIITLLISGRPLIINEALKLSDGFIASWLPGSEGAGVADILLGDAEPAGKLPFSWPRNIAQLPINIGDENYDPLFPLGYGLTY